MTIELIIDTRERELIEKLQFTSKIKIEQLDIGDIVFRNNDEDLLVIERKTVKDLKSSICDGRSREQKTRLLGSTPKHRILYLIEGSMDKPLDTKIDGIPISTLVGSLINTQLRDGIKVYKTSSLNETCEFLRKLHDKMEKDGQTFFNQEEISISDGQYSSSLKKKKKANMTHKVWFISQLCLIPQVTEKVAEVILERYPNVSELILEYKSTPIHLREKLLSNITYSLKTGKSRRVGDKISTRIYKFLHGLDVVDVVDNLDISDNLDIPDNTINVVTCV